MENCFAEDSDGIGLICDGMLRGREKVKDGTNRFAKLQQTRWRKVILSAICRLVTVFRKTVIRGIKLIAKNSAIYGVYLQQARFGTAFLARVVQVESDEGATGRGAGLE